MADSTPAISQNASAPAVITFGHCAVMWAGGVPAAPRSRMERVVALAASGPVDERRTRCVVENLLRALADEGHHHARVEPRDFCLHGNSLDFTLAVDPGPPTVIASWRFDGLSRTDTVWLARVLDLRVRSAATRVVLQAVERRLRGISHLRMVSSPEVELLPDDTLAIVTLHLREQPAATVAGALAAGEQSTTAGSPLTGSLVLGMAGMFRRDRSLGLRYERLHGDEMLLRLDLAEAGKARGRWNWRAQLEEWNRRDHRQHVRLETDYRLDRQRDLRVYLRGRWAKITPDRVIVPSARTTEIGIGIGQGMLPAAAFSSGTVQSAWSVRFTLSTRHELATPVTRDRGLSRTLFETDLACGLSLAPHLHVILRGSGRWWPRSEARLGPGDEWFLGGAGWLRGYTERTVVAASGLATSLELSTDPDNAIGVAIFADVARLAMFDGESGSSATPYSYGTAMLLRSPTRSGRLEFAWRDHAAWRDGIVRLAISQGW